MGYIRQSENVVRAAFTGLMGTRAFVNVVYVSFAEGDFSEPNAIQVLTSARDVWQSEVMDQVINNYQFEEVAYLSIDPLEEFGGSLPANPLFPLIGALVDSASPPNVAVLVHKNPLGAPRGFRPGRLYLPPPVEDSVGELGTITTAYQGLLDAKLALWQATLNDPGGTIGNVHVVPSWPGLTSPPPEAPTPVLSSAQVRVASLTTDGLAATQRRRMRG